MRFVFVLVLLVSCSSDPSIRTGITEDDLASLRDVDAGDTTTSTQDAQPDVQPVDADDTGAPELDADDAVDGDLAVDGDSNAASDTGGAADTIACSCEGLECGVNACGETCGQCPQAAPYCYDNVCAITCQPACDGRACGDDGCGGTCGTCGANEVCQGGQCACIPACEDKECGDDGCGGICGACPAAAPFCVADVCAVACPTQCDGKVCGDDGCGGSCGSCEAAEGCVAGACVDCSCDDIECGPGPCGDSCGACPQAAPHCVAGLCQVEASCATAVIGIAEGVEVIPQTVLHLDGSASHSVAGEIGTYHWEVQQPPGSVSTFKPNADVASPMFEVNVAGTYVFTLTVRGPSDAPCAEATATAVVHVDSDVAIHVEILWNTPADPDQSDEGPVAGSDVDLHFAHPFATGGYDGDGDGKPDGWFDGQFDCFWFNHHPNWGSLDPAIDDDPGLDRDDSDGAGPESVNLATPENGLTYKIGVHHWDDHGYGVSYVTVRVYIFGALVEEIANVPLANHDMWTVGTIDWPAGTVNVARVCSGTVTTCSNDGECGSGACVLRIAEGYNHPFFPND